MLACWPLVQEMSEEDMDFHRGKELDYRKQRRYVAATIHSRSLGEHRIVD